MRALQEEMDQRYLVEIQMLKEKIKKIRKSILEMTASTSPGIHVGASLSCIDIIATLYFMKMRHSPYRPDWSDRDRFILSKGHAAPALYAVLAEAGYFSKEEFGTLKSLNSRLQGHPDLRTPGVDAPSGSLGQGLSIGIGMALAAKHRGSKNRIYVLVGDGECEEHGRWAEGAEDQQALPPLAVREHAEGDCHDGHSETFDPEEESYCRRQHTNLREVGRYVDQQVADCQAVHREGNEHQQYASRDAFQEITATARCALQV